nr:hypothetical protein Iba_chr01dCG9420 [Ipomoea batatas]
MYIIINLHIEICIPESNSSSKICLCLSRQLKVPLNMFLSQEISVLLVFCFNCSIKNATRSSTVSYYKAHNNASFLLELF